MQMTTWTLGTVKAYVHFLLFLLSLFFLSYTSSLDMATGSKLPVAGQ